MLIFFQKCNLKFPFIHKTEKKKESTKKNSIYSYVQTKMCMFYKNYYAHVEKRIAAMKKDNCLKIRKVFNFCFQFPHKSLYRKGKKFENCENFRSLFILIITRNLFKVIFVNKIQKKIAVELPNTFFKKIMFTLLNTLTICTCFSNFHFGI